MILWLYSAATTRLRADKKEKESETFATYCVFYFSGRHLTSLQGRNTPEFEETASRPFGVKALSLR